MKEGAIGIDVSKGTLDCAVSGKDEIRSFGNSEEGIERLCSWAKGAEATVIVLEATGKYHRLCEQRLREAGLPVRIINPKRLRDYAKAIGVLAKTDRIDCKVIASFAATVQPEERMSLSKNGQKLRELVERRQQLIAHKTAELSRLECVSPEVKSDIMYMIRVLNVRLKRLELQIKALISEPEFADRARILDSVPGVGPVLISTLLSALPEIGTIDKRKIAALVGVAPFNRDSGTLKGKRTTYGGRPTVRRALYMATLSATRYNPWVRDFYQRLIARGKSPLTALIAAMRKLLISLNAIVRDNRPWRTA